MRLPPLPPLVDHASGVRLEAPALAAELARASAWLASFGGHPLALSAEVRAGEIVTCLAALWSGRSLLLLHPRWPAPQSEEMCAGAIRLPPLAEWRARPWRALDAGGAAAAAWDERACVRIATSGTSGAPKLLELSRRACAAAARMTARALDTAGGRLLVTLPYAHVGGLGILLRALGSGATLIAAAGPFDALQLRATCDAERVTHVSLTPTQLARVVFAGVRAPTSLRLALIGGAACAPALLAEARALGWPARASYGLTETVGLVALDGLPLEGVGLRIVDGRVAVSAPALSRELVTQDLGHFDAGGRLVIDGRADDIVICGGENVSPSAVEARLASQPSVRAACVLAQPDAEWGHTLAALIEPRHAGDPSIVAALQRWARAELAPWQRPRRWRVVAALPLGAGGKVDRRAARDLL